MSRRMASYSGEKPLLPSMRMQSDSSVVDPNPAFERAFQKTNLYYADGHWNAEGHHLFAQIVEDEILKK